MIPLARRSALPLFVLLAILLTMMTAIATSCSPSSKPIENVEAVRAYADPATQITLEGLSENNLEKYTRYGNPEFKTAVTQAVLDKANTQITSQLGTYESIEFLRAEDQQGYIIVHYRAKYSQGAAGVRMVFDSQQMIAGQWFE